MHGGTYDISAESGLAGLFAVSFLAATLLPGGSEAALFAFLGMLFVIIRAALFGDPVAGWPSLMVTILFIGGVQFTFMGILGEYVGRIYNESKGRPPYIVGESTREKK